MIHDHARNPFGHDLRRIFHHLRDRVRHRFIVHAHETHVSGAVQITGAIHGHARLRIDVDYAVLCAFLVDNVRVILHPGEIKNSAGAYAPALHHLIYVGCGHRDPLTADDEPTDFILLVIFLLLRFGDNIKTAPSHLIRPDAALAIVVM